MNIGLLAHDSKRKLIQNFCIAYRGIFNKHDLYATEATGRAIEEVTNLQTHKFLSGSMGGMQQLGSMIDMNQIDLVFFIRDPESPIQHSKEDSLILKLCDSHSIPLATNIATAELLIKALDRGDLDWREIYK